MAEISSQAKRYQARIIGDLKAALPGAEVIERESDYRSHFTFAMGRPDNKWYQTALEVSFEENVTVWLRVGKQHPGHGFYSEGAEVQLTNMTEDVVVLSAKAILGLL